MSQPSASTSRSLLVLSGSVALVGWGVGCLALCLTLPTLALPLAIGLGVLLAVLAPGWWLVAVRLDRRHRSFLLGEQDRRNRLIVDTAADAIVTFDYHGRVESFNAAASRLFGYLPDEVIGQDISLLIESTSGSEVDSFMRKAIRTGSARVLAPGSAFQGRHRDGRAIPIELGVSKVLDQDRHVYIQIIRDLTEREQVERHRLLHVEVARLLGGDGPVEAVGSGLLQIIAEAFGWPAGVLRLADPEADELRVAATWVRDLDDGLVDQAWLAGVGQGVGLAGQAWSCREPRHADAGLAWPVMLADEVLGVLEFRAAAAMPPPDEAIARCLMPIATQLAQFTRRWRDQEALRRAKEQAEEASRSKGEFLANVSHEMRTPLNGILGLTEVMRTEEMAPAQREYLELVESSAQTLLGLIDDLLDLAKVEAARMSLDVVKFQVRQSLEPTLRTLAVRAGQKGLAFQWLIHSDVPAWLVGDPLRLQQILLNLAGNAVKFTASGEVQVRLAVADRTSREVMLHGSVRDTGIGIPREKQPQIFDAFYQVESSRSRRYPGTGLGLTITAHLLALMGGRVWVESKVGQGSTFYFTASLGLPEVEVSADAVPAPGDNALRTPPLGKKLLVAEDNPVNRVLLDLILAKRKHQVTFVGSGREALEACAAEAFDLILMDVQIPEIDGLETARQLPRQGKRVPPIVGLTAHPSEESRRSCLDAGMRGYLTKPVQPGELLTVIDELLRS